MRLQGKVAIVTGGASGIGRATALLFAREGAKVIIADVNEDLGGQVASEIRSAGGEAEFVRTDVTKSEDVQGMVQQAVELFGGIGVLFNCAGTQFIGKDVECHNTSEETWERTLALNLTGTFLASKYVIPQMIEGGGGSIINTSSISGIIGRAANAAYAASKGGVIGLAKSISYDYLNQNIRANVVIPGRVDTPLLRQLMADPSTPGEPDCGEPEDVAYAVLYLASDESRFITGTEIIVDHGVSAR
ncbi:MAG: SDR family oxidoreductase [Chloroflexi bacterium]|nr:SDR family oxidoreductase [Chloroflexota bacterium]